MTPIEFEECNAVFRPPPDLVESQCMTIHAYKGEVKSGSVDGVPIVVVAWIPCGEELKRLQQGDPLFITFIGGLPPHYPSTTFHEATHPV